ncbi:acetate--CoA ligase family protein [Cellulomonas persica]|uniref:CoA-binding protein n=1 Tax=Cellulomonas persica TaxID=76861 RepID=A0A510UUI1_9CELL|nr:acetate--CoA ligase family protein [Cellulomonas persica]GEK18288.1 CoA-binding protein [Cellulomonas persica]
MTTVPSADARTTLAPATRPAATGPASTTGPAAPPAPYGLDPLFRPASIAVVGASAQPDKAGHAMLQALRRFPGALHPVNPRGGEILGRPVLTSLRESSDVDLAVLVVPPVAVPAALEDAAAAGVRAAVVCAGGFAESGPQGAAVQERAASVAREAGIRLLGPNTSGFMNPVDRVTANFMPAVADLTPGTVSIVAQSGGVNLTLAFLLARAGVGLRLGVGLGNAVDVDFPEVLDLLADDDATTAVGLHVEGVGDGPALVAALRRTTARKPVVAFKVGRSDVSEFARSHTGAMIGSYGVTRAALAQAGAVVVDSLEELVAALVALRAVRLPVATRVGVGLLTGQAGPGLVVTDALGARGIELPPLTAATQQRLTELLPPLTFQRNPVDTGRPSPEFGQVLAAVAGDPGIDVLGVYALDEPGALDPVAALGPAAGRVLFATGGPQDAIEQRAAALADAGIPTLGGPGELATGLAAVVADARLRAVPDAPPAPASRTVGRALDEHEAKSLLESLGVRCPARRVADDRAQAHAALADLTRDGVRVVVKVLDAAVTHKSDVGGVHVGVHDPVALDRALDAIDAIPSGTTAPAGADASRRYLLEEMAAPGTELIVGAVRDPAFGPVVLLGLGGVAAELGREPVLRLAPLSPERSEEMVRALPSAVLAGFRGAPPVDIAALATVLRAVGDLIVDHGDVTEVDLNPVRVTPDGPLALDALVVTEP